MKLFVTGANGFIGRAVCQAAIAAGHAVMGLARSPQASLPQGCERATGSMSALPWDIIEHFAPEAALHLAWTAVPGVNYFSEENQTLITDSEALFRGLAVRGVQHLAATGSLIEYASTPLPLREADRLDPLVPYSKAKVETCRRLENIATNAEVPWTWFRLFNIYGEGEHRDRMTSWVMRRLMRGESATLRSPASIRDYTHVQDAAEAILLGMEKRIPGPINVASGKGVTIRELAHEIADVVKAPKSLLIEGTDAAPDPMPTATGDISILTSIGWRQRIELAAGLASLHTSLRDVI